MKQLIIFEAEDGTRFNTAPGCLQYEAILAKVTAALDGLWHPGADNHMFNTGRQPVAHYFFDNPSAWPCLRMAHKRMMSMDDADREWCDPVTCRENSGWRADFSDNAVLAESFKGVDLERYPLLSEFLNNLTK